jgi:hypothetical protein
MGMDSTALQTDPTVGGVIRPYYLFPKLLARVIMLFAAYLAVPEKGTR